MAMELTKTTTFDPAESLEYLHGIAKEVDDFDCGACSRLIRDSAFRMWPASPRKHHTWDGGLVQHTAQVLQAALSICSVAAQAGKPMDERVVICASIFHDSGKIHDYDYVENATGIKHWAKNEHFVKIHHVVKSYEIWTEMSKGADPEFVAEVQHCILAHHGRLEWGSPVLPVTKEAWAVHLADMTSVHCIEERQG